MIIVNPNVLYTNNILIGEEVIIKTIHTDTGITMTDENGKKYIQYNVSYLAFLKRLYLSEDENGNLLKDNAPTLLIDNLDYDIIIYAPIDLSLNNIGELYKYFNDEFVKYMINQGILKEGDYKIVESV